MLGITGFGTAARDETARAILKILPHFDEQSQTAARRFLEQLQYAPGERPRRVGQVPRDFRCLLYEFEDLANEQAVDIMRHRLGFDGGPRRSKEETAVELGVSEGAVNQADYKVAKFLKDQDAFGYALDWLQSLLRESNGLLKITELEERLDRSCSPEPREVHSSLRLLDRVYGHHSPWVYDGEWVVDSKLQEFCCRLSADGPRPPYQLAELPLQEETECSPKLARLGQFLSGQMGFRVGKKNDIVSYSESPGLGEWAAYILYRAGQPLEQSKLLRRLARYAPNPVSKRDIWTLLRRDPRAVKISLKPSVWAWLPHLDVTEEEILSLLGRVEKELKSGEASEHDIRELHARHAPETVTPTLLAWLLKGDPRFRTSRWNTGLNR